MTLTLKEMEMINNTSVELISFANRLHYMDVDIRLDLNQKIEKSDRKLKIQPEALRTIDTIHDRYPSCDWLYAYRDGSIMDLSEEPSAGIFVNFFAFISQLETSQSIFMENSDQYLLYFSSCLFVRVLLRKL